MVMFLCHTFNILGSGYRNRKGPHSVVWVISVNIETIFSRKGKLSLYTVKSVMRDPRSSETTSHLRQQFGCTNIVFPVYLTRVQRRSVLKEHFYVVERVVSDDKFFCILNNIIINSIKTETKWIRAQTIVKSTCIMTKNKKAIQRCKIIFQFFVMSNCTNI